MAYLAFAYLQKVNEIIMERRNYNWRQMDDTTTLIIIAKSEDEMLELFG